MFRFPSMHRAFCVALLIGTILLDAPGAPAGGTPEGTVARQFEVARHSPCERPHPSSIAYHYPIRPFRRQHPIRGFFGDPRTLAAGRLGADSSRSQGSFTFHNGIDIVAPVYPVVGGVVEALYYHDEVSVSRSDGRVFQY